MNLINVFDQNFKKSTAENFPYDECIDLKDNIYIGSKKYTCLIVKNDSYEYTIKVLKPMIASHLDEDILGWFDEDNNIQIINFYNSIKTSHVSKVIAFKEFSENDFIKI